MISDRTDEEIVKQTEDLAREFASVMGWQIERSEQFWNSRNPRVLLAWELACIAQQRLTATEPMDAASAIDFDAMLSDEIAHAHHSVADGI